MPAATTRAKKPLATRTNDVDSLAVKLDAKLKIGDAVGARARKPAASKTTAELKSDTMRTVNSVLRTLSNSEEGKNEPLTSVSSAVSSGRTALNLLRKLDPKLLDTERAALSMAGRLLAKDMHEDAALVLFDILKYLPGHYSCSRIQPSQLTPISLLELPSPSSQIDAPLATIVSTFFSLSMTVIGHFFSTKVPSIDDILQVLDSEPLLSWSQHLLSWLPSKTTDSLFKRIYATLTSASVTANGSQIHILRLRFHALRLLLLSAELDASSFWEQCIKFAASYARKAGGKEDEECRATVLLGCFEGVEAAAGSRKEGKGWIAFCEYRMMLSKRLRDDGGLNHCVEDIKAATSSSKDNSVIEAQLNASFLQIISTLEGQGPRSGLLHQQTEFSISAMTSLSAHTGSKLAIANKTRRSLESCRKASLKALSSLDSASILQSPLIKLCDAIISFLEKLKGKPEFTVAILDSLFQLATVFSTTQQPDAYDQAFAYLEQAQRIVENNQTGSSDEECLAHANYIRCLSGAFANIAGILYKSERHGFAVRFLTQGCPLSNKATALYNKEIRKNFSDELPEKDAEAWKTHRNQVYRRWELLGICHLKTGNRKEARTAFVQGIITYPFDEANTSLPPALATAVDRLTHLSVVELNLDPTETSLKNPLVATGAPQYPIASVLNQQINSLTDQTKPHITTTVAALLQDLLELYEPNRHPVRHAQVLVLILEHRYFSSTVSDALNHVNKVKQAIDGVLSDKSSIGEDGSLVQLRPFIRAQASLWVILNAHRAGSSPADLLRLAEASLLVLQALFPSASAEKDSGVMKGRRVGRFATSAAAKATNTRASNKRAAAAKSKAITARLKSSCPPPKTPKSVEDRTLDGNSESDVASNQLFTSTRSKLIELMLTVSELLGLYALVEPRMKILIAVRNIVGNISCNTVNEYFMQASCMLASDLMILGRESISKELLVPLVESLSKSGHQSSGTVYCMLKNAEVLSIMGNSDKSYEVYTDAAKMAEQNLNEDDERGLPWVARIRGKVRLLEHVAHAAKTFALIQDAKENFALALKARLQVLRLLNRATEMLSRLGPQKPTKPSESDDPFAMTDVKHALSGEEKSPDRVQDQKHALQATRLDGLEWRIASALLEILQSLGDSYAVRGSAREAEYFIKQSEELARVLGSHAMISRSLLRKAEVQLALGQLDESQRTLEEAKELLSGSSDMDMADVNRALGDLLVRHACEGDARKNLDHAMKLLCTAQETYCEVEQGIVASRGKVKGGNELFAPLLRGRILRQQVWLSRDELGEKYEKLLDQLLALPQVPFIEVYVNSMLGRLALYDLHERFRSDMALSSLIESTIALPLGMASPSASLYTPPQDITDALEQAEEHYASDLSRLADLDSVSNVRAAAISAALTSVYQTPTGLSKEDAASFVSHVLDLSASITLRRELLDAILFKFPESTERDDTWWPSETPVEERAGRSRSKSRPRIKTSGKKGLFDELSDGEDDECASGVDNMQKYWAHVLQKHRNASFIQADEPPADINALPDKWMVVNITLTEDKTALLISRQRPKHEPVVFYVPLKGRREEESEEHFTFDDASAELQEILELSKEATSDAATIKSEDKEAKSEWWARRKALDLRLKELLENIEFCWLGAFKTILSEQLDMPSEVLSSLRSRFEKVFRRILGSHEKRVQKAKLRLESSILSLFATLPSSCKDEELQDIVYFVLDLYHFYGIPIAFEEVDVDVVVVDLRSALEDHHAKAKGKVKPVEGAHTFLVLDRHVQSIPWESMSVLRGRSVSRVPGISFILDRLALTKYQNGLSLDDNDDPSEDEERAKYDEKGAADLVVDPSRGYFVLNPSGDLTGTESRFKSWASSMSRNGWSGVVGSAPSEQQLLHALQTRSLFVYFGHSGAEQYVRSHKVRHLTRCAPTMLWGCSSGFLRPQGDFDPCGTPNNYMLAGCPALVANLWDVTDRDIDKFAMSVFEKVGLVDEKLEKKSKGKASRTKRNKVSVCEAVGKSREVCKLQYLTGAAVVVYGVPYYL